MKLTLQIKLLPTEIQSESLLNTIKSCNVASNSISATAWNSKEFNRFKLHHLVYHYIKQSTDLTANAIVRCIAKVSDAYKLNKHKQNVFKPFGGISYDPKIFSYKTNEVSIWSIDGRLKIPFICHNPKILKHIKGEADLVYRKGKFFLLQCVDIKELPTKQVDKFLGVDMGVTDIATLSDGTHFSSKQLNAVRDKYFKVRRSVQSKGTKGSKKLLTRLRGREQRHATIVNHTISKRIVNKAKRHSMGIAMEDLTGIRDRTTVRKEQRRKHHSWAFSQLRQFIAYKAQRAGIPIAVVNPRNTSKTCNTCGVIGIRSGKNFRCPSCGNIADADINAAKNIAQLGLFVNQPEKINMFGSSKHMTS